MEPQSRLEDESSAQYVRSDDGQLATLTGNTGGLAAELGSHQVDVAEWMFGSPPESIVGVGGHDYMFDGRDINDNLQFIYKYPKKQKLISMYICTSTHLSLFGGARTEFGEKIMGTEGSVEITVGDDTRPVLAMWYREAFPLPSRPPGRRNPTPPARPW